MSIRRKYIRPLDARVVHLQPAHYPQQLQHIISSPQSLGHVQTTMSSFKALLGASAVAFLATITPVAAEDNVTLSQQTWYGCE